MTLASDEKVQAAGSMPLEGTAQPGRPTVGGPSDADRPPARLEVFRASRQEEILEIRDIALEFHGESRYAHLLFSEKKFIRFFSKAISSPEDTLALYVKYRGETVALLNAGVGDYYLGEGGRMVTVYVMYVSARLRHSLLGGRIGIRLIRMVSDWARAQGAGELHIHATSGIDALRTDKLLGRLGFRPYGGNYAAALAMNAVG